MLIGYPTQPIMDSERNEASFKLSVTEYNKGCQNTHVFDCIGKERLAQRIVANVKEGKEIAIDGSLRNNDYEDGLGQCHTYTWIVVNDLFIIGKD